MKPTRSEAFVRLRANTIALTFLGIITYLLPVPSLFTATRISWYGLRKQGVFGLMKDTGSWAAFEGACFLEFLLVLVLAFNISEALFALRFPRKPPPPKTYPPTPKPNVSTPQTQKVKLSQALSPSASPQPQRPYRTPVPASSFTLSFASPSPLVGSPLAGNNSPKPPVMMSPNASLASSTLSFASSMGSPSPMLSAYKGKHVNGAGRPLDAPFLSRLLAAQSEDDDDDSVTTS